MGETLAERIARVKRSSSGETLAERIAREKRALERDAGGDIDLREPAPAAGRSISQVARDAAKGPDTRRRDQRWGDDIARLGMRGLGETGTAAARFAGWISGTDAPKDWADRTDEEMREFWGEPETGAGKIGYVAGRMLGEGATMLAGGAGVGKAIARTAQGSGRAARVARPMAQAIAAGRKGSVAQRVAAQTAPFVPIDFAMGAGAAPEGERLKGGAVNVALGAGGAAAIESIPSIFRTARAAIAKIPTSRRKAAEALDPSIADELRGAHRAAETDVTTGVANARALKRALPAAEADEATTVTLFDANNFGRVNKIAGHEEGDAVLADIADALRRAADEADAGDRVFRKGGDEFVVLAPKDKADRIRARATEIFGDRVIRNDATGETVVVSISGNTGPTFKDADAGLQTVKAARKAAQLKGQVRAPVDADAPPAAAAAADDPDPDDVARFFEDEPAPARAGFSAAPLAGTVATSGTGAAAGAALDDENPLRGAAVGAGIGAGVGIVGARALRPRPAHVPAYLSDPDMQGAVQQIGGGRGGAPGKPTSLYTSVIDETTPLQKFGREFDTVEPERLKWEVARAKRYKGAGEVRVRTELKGVLKAIPPEHQPGVRGLAHDERLIELSTHGVTIEPAELARAQRNVAKNGADPDLRRGVDALRDYYHELLLHKLRNGVIDAGTYNAIRAKGQAYVPFIPDELSGEIIASAGGGRLVNKRTGVRAWGAKELDKYTKVDPFEQAALDTYETERTVAKQRVTNIVSEIVENNPRASAFIRRVPPKWLATSASGKPVLAAPQGKHIVQANIRGKRQYYEVLDQDLFDAWAAFDPKVQNVFQKSLSAFKTTLRTGVTAHPGFLVSNAMRDFVHSLVQYPLPVREYLVGTAIGAGVGAATAEEGERVGGALRGAVAGGLVGTATPHAFRVMSAMHDIIGRTPDYEAWMREGGAGFSEFYAKPKEARKLIRQLQQSRTVKMIDVRNWSDAYFYIGKVIEEAPRVARAKYVRGQGASWAEAAFESGDISLNFTRIGRHTKEIANWKAFFNAQLQGWDKLARMLRKRKTYAIAAATITAPSVALWTVNKDDPEYWKQPEWLKNTTWLIPLPESVREKHGYTFLAIPKPFELGYIFASLPERILDWTYSNDDGSKGFRVPWASPAELPDWIRGKDASRLPFIGGDGPDLRDRGAEAFGAVMPTAVTPLIENVANYDFFRKQPVVSRAIASEGNPELEYDDRTTSVAKVAGEKTGMSPAKIDNTLREWFGTTGAELSEQVGDRIGRATGLDKRPLPLRRMPVAGRFFTAAEAPSEQESRFWDRWKRAEDAYKGARKLEREGDFFGLERHVNKHERELIEYDALKPAYRELLELRAARKEIARSTEYSKDEKRRMLRALANMATEVIAGPPQTEPDDDLDGFDFDD